MFDMIPCLISAADFMLKHEDPRVRTHGNMVELSARLLSDDGVPRRLARLEAVPERKASVANVSCQPWKNTEDEALRRAINVLTKEFATTHGRTPGAVKARMKKLLTNKE